MRTKRVARTAAMIRASGGAVAVTAILASAIATASCAPAKPEKLERPKRVEHDDVGELVRPQLVDRPTLQLVNPAPDFHDELRWPLTAMSHPALEPKFDIASQFAEVGVGWMELCARGVQNTTGRDKEMLAYLRGWCAAIHDDAETACTNLTPLLHSTRSGLATAVRSDLANILANSHADRAAHLIKANDIRDVTVLDLLAANYVEVGTTAEARAFNRDAIASDDYASAATKCTRLTKAIILAGDKTSPLLLDIKDLATTPKLPDPTCVRLHHKLACWRDQAECRAYLADEGLDAPLVALTDAYYSWPNGTSQRHWLDIVDRAIGAAPLPGAGDIVFAALENAVRAEPCSDATKSWLSVRTSAFRALLDAPAQAKLDAIIASCR